MNDPLNTGYFSAQELLDLGFAGVGKNTMLARNCTVIGREHIQLGSNTRIDGPTVIVAGKAGVSIGNYVHIGGGCHLAGRDGISMADFSGLSQGVRIYSVTDNYAGGSFTNPTVPAAHLKLISGPVRLEKHVIIGAGSVILPSVTVGEGASVGALSLVNRSLEAWTVNSGVPARKLKARIVIDPDGSIERELLAKC
ncbi:acyltransferase [Henriciella mobilis]|uniref:acyltransferase n=1 Tax=Henriciella mobilis TaxID=2305467 RepID=UPI000E6602B5|nr:acyltransferase [Henriciella mobilis]RIJ17152.1 acyltransferase [Henriciella mobilis]RIJ22759.1 acyltransferase [Henriciella mobilis]